MSLDNHKTDLKKTYKHYSRRNSNPCLTRNIIKKICVEMGKKMLGKFEKLNCCTLLNRGYFFTKVLKGRLKHG